MKTKPFLTRITSLIVILFSICVLFGCAPKMIIPMNSDKDYGFSLQSINSSGSGVQLYFSIRPEKKYDEIAYVFSLESSIKEALEGLKKNAAKAGADAVVDIHIGSVQGGYQITGVAVKFK